MEDVGFCVVGLFFGNVIVIAEPFVDYLGTCTVQVSGVRGFVGIFMGFGVSLDSDPRYGCLQYAVSDVIRDAAYFSCDSASCVEDPVYSEISGPVVSL